MKKLFLIIWLLAFPVICSASMFMAAGGGESGVPMLAGYDQRLTLTIDSDKVDSELTDFPVMIKISDASGIGDVDVSAVFDELGFPAVAHVFSSDENCVALWRFETGSALVDSIGSNTLTDNNTVGSDTTYEREGVSALSIEGAEYLSIADASLDSGFPLKDGSSDPTFSVCGWFKGVPLATRQAYVSKWDYGLTADDGKTFTINSSQLEDIEVYLGYDGGAETEVLVSGEYTIIAGVFYHFGFTYDNSDKSWKFRLWNSLTETVVLNLSGTSTNNMSVGPAPFAIGARFNDAAAVDIADSYIDEVVVFSDVLTTDEIDYIREGVYNHKQIAVTTSDNTQCYVEVDEWNNSGEEIILHAKIPVVSNSEDDTLFVYYDADKEDNSYVALEGEAGTHDVWDENFQIVYHMNQDPDPLGDVILDSTDSANHADPDASMESDDLVTGLVGSCLTFVASQYMYVTAAGDYMSNNIGTVSVWTKPDVDNATGFLWGFEDNRDYIQMYANGGAQAHAVAEELNVNTMDIYSGTAQTSGTWTYLTMTQSGTAGQLYFNGAANDHGAQTNAGTWFNDADATRMIIGDNNEWSGGYSGLIDEFRVSDSVRSAAWIKATYNTLLDSLITFSE